MALYRKRGNAEAHMGEVKSVLDVHLTSTDRGSSTVQDVMDRNEVSLLLSLYAYQVLHGLRCLLKQQTQHGWSLRWLREQVLKVAATNGGPGAGETDGSSLTPDNTTKHSSRKATTTEVDGNGCADARH